MKKIFILTLFFLISASYAQTLEEQLPELVKKLSAQLIKKDLKKITALDFTDIQGNPSILGRYLAEQLTVDFVGVEGITVLDRSNINSIMAEHKLTADGLVKPENAKKLGQFAGVDVLLIGTVTLVDEMITVTVKAISTESAALVAAGRIKFKATKDFTKMLSTSVKMITGKGSIQGNASASSIEGDAIATRKLGPATIILRNITKFETKKGRSIYPAIRATFEVYNQDLRKSIVISANSNIDSENYSFRRVTILNSRSSLIDSFQKEWKTFAIKGVSALANIELVSNGSSGSVHKQGNPSAIVSYVKKNEEYKPGESSTRNAWIGSFSIIPPTEKIRITLDYFYEEYLTNKNEFKYPDFFQLDAEFVIGTIEDGEVPEKAKDLALRNLTIDKIILNPVSKKSK